MEAKQTPLIELLERVPQDARVVVEHDQFSSSSHPVGRLCHEAAAALRAALAEPQCMCREPWALERVHREKTPCFDYVERKPLTELEMPTLFVGGLALNSEATTEIVRAVEKAHGIGEQHE